MIDLLTASVGTPLVIEELKHRPGRRRTIRASGPERRVIVKIYASERASDVAARLNVLADGPPEPLVPRVLGLDPALHLLMLSELEGRTLRELLLAGDVAGCARVGAALGRWHAAWTGIAPEPLRPHTCARELEILRRRADAASAPVARLVARAMPALADEWPCSTVVHRDLYEEQVLLGERVALIDLDDVAIGPPELDIGNLTGHVELLERRRQRDLARELRALLEGYADTGPSLDPILLGRCRALTLLRLACLNDDPNLAASALTSEVRA